MFVSAYGLRLASSQLKQFQSLMVATGGATKWKDGGDPGSCDSK
jgi:hypothetical protein